MRGVEEMCQRVKRAAEDGTLVVDSEEYKAVGKGQYGGVYLNNESKAVVAKVQKDGAEFRNEVSIMMTLQNCDFVPRYYSHFSCKGVGYILMEPLVKPKDGEATTEKVRDLLQRMYDTGWLHLDNHRFNVMKRPSTGELVLIDLGLSLPFSRKFGDAHQFMHSSSAHWEPNFTPCRVFYLWSYQIHLLHCYFPGPLLSAIQGGPYATSKHSRDYTQISFKLMKRSPEFLPEFTPQRVLFWAWGESAGGDVKQAQVTKRANIKRTQVMPHSYFMVHPVYEFVALRGPSINHEISNNKHLKRQPKGVYDFESEGAMIDAMKEVVNNELQLPSSILEGELQLLKAQKQKQQRKENIKPNPPPRQDPTKALGLKVAPASAIKKQRAQQAVKQRYDQKVQRVKRLLKPTRIDD